MHNGILIVGLILVLIIGWICWNKVNEKKVEGYYDVQPYEYHWDIFKCYDYPCVLDKSYKCYKACNKMDEEGAQHNCRQRCLDYADIQIEQLRLPNRDFNYLLPTFEQYSKHSHNTGFYLM